MLTVKSHVGVKAVFQFTTYNADGTVKEQSGDSPNIVLDQGLDRMGVGSYIDAVAVGTGNSEPATTQTALDVQVAYTSAEQGNYVLTYEAEPVPRYVLKKRYRFNAGAFNNDNLTEVSIGWTASGFEAWNRALILDTLGVPTSLTLLSDEYLDVSILVYYYPPTEDSTQTLNVVDGEDQPLNEITITTRSANLGKFDPPTQYSRYGGVSIYGTVTALIGQNYWMTLHDGDIGINTSEPQGAQLAGTRYGDSSRVKLVADDYIAGSHKATGSFVMQLDGGNGLIRSMFIQTSLGCYQSQFEPPIEKLNTQTLTIPVALSWGRYNVA